jgi:hypothetical protein
MANLLTVQSVKEQNEEMAKQLEKQIEGEIQSCDVVCRYLATKTEPVSDVQRAGLTLTNPTSKICLSKVSLSEDT